MGDSKIKFKVSDEQLEELYHKYCRDFTQLARAGRFDPITGRDEEIDQAILILLQKGRKNVALLAPAGVGKTALCAGLAQQIIAGNVPDYLKDARVMEIDLAAMSAGTTGPAEFQGRFLPLCKGVAERYHDPAYPKVILFIDEMHQIMPSCAGSAYKGLSEVIKPYLTVGDLHVIGATTLDEFRIYVAIDPAMDRRFQKVFLAVPDVPQTIAIVKNLKAGYEKHHKITVSDKSIETIVHLTEEHMRKRNQPDKSIIMMDAAMAHHVKLHGTGGELKMESVYYMISKETGISPNALKRD
ncbi:MAG TPA: ATP-dependent Clp protease ATP-binding subunit [Rhodospirillaceae bacterium]|nr:ATP-dependent Clp protease ATP-binding subunit [Rhodospirillaceae bacterium]